MNESDFLNIDKLHRPSVVWRPLIAQGVLANTPDDIARNIEHSLERDYIPFSNLVNTKQGAVAIVGSGPSLKETWRQLLEFDGDIIACNAAFKFLLDKGITPAYMLCFDADPLTHGFFIQHSEVTYLIASRCPPKALELLKGCKVVVWHASGDEHLERLLIEHGKLEPMVIGGTAAVTRAICVTIAIGYRELHFYGADSSFANGDTHIGKSTTEERRMAIMCNGRVFETAPWMTIQVEDFKILGPKFTKRGVRFILHGDGLLQHVARELGFRTDYENVVQQWLREFKRDWQRNATILWQHI